jgi:hypothetical protein
LPYEYGSEIGDPDTPELIETSRRDLDGVTSTGATNLQDYEDP